MTLKEKLALYIMVGLAISVTMFGSTQGSKMEGIFRDVFGGLWQPPLLLHVLFSSAAFWVSLPLALLLLHLWSVLRKDKRHVHWVWHVVVFGCLACIFLVVLAGFYAILMLRHVGGGLMP